MDYCKYHPLEAATFHCPNCEIDHCDQCIGYYDKQHNVVCHFCKQPMEIIGTGNTAVPFWRRLEAAFRYPLNKQALPVILLISLGSTLVASVALYALPLLIVYLALNGAMLKYALRCLEHTAAGDMAAPTPGDAYSGGLDLLGKLMIIFILLAGILFVLGAYISQVLAGIYSLLILLSLPAILIHFAHSEDILDTLNPLNWLRLIASIGLPYGLLIAFVMIMMGSVGVINELIGSRWSILGAALQSAVSNYYMVVLFHMMGYMLFQYQDKLGFSARASDNDMDHSELDLINARIDVQLKEGEYDLLVSLFQDGIRKHPEDKPLAKRFFDFCVATRRKDLIANSADHYFQRLFKTQEFDRLNADFTAACRIYPALLPKHPATRLQLAKMARAKGDAKTAVRLLNGLQKQAPGFGELVEAFSVMAQALSDLGLQPQAEKCRAHAAKLAKSQKSQRPTTSTASRFEARDLSPDASPEKVAQAAPKTSANQNSTPDEPEDLPPIEFKL